MLSAHVAGVTVFLFVAILAPVTAQSTYTRQSLTGSDVILPCDYDQATDGNWFLIAWSVQLQIGGDFQNLYVRREGTTGNAVTDPPAQFAGRVAIDGVTNLRLTGVTIADEDQYRCIVTAQTSPTTYVNLQVFQQSSRPVVQVQYDPQPSDMFSVPLNTTVTFTCTSTGGKPPASLNWAVKESGNQVSVNPTYTSSNNSQGVGDATSTFNFTTTKYGVRYGVECVSSGPESSPIQTQRSTTVSFTTEPDPSVTTTPKGQTVVTSVPISASKSPGQDGTKQPQTGAGLGTGGVVGIVIGVLAAIIVALALVYFLVIRKKRAVESGDDEVTYHAAGHPGAPENMSRPPPNQPEVMYAELDLKNAPAGSRKPYVATPDDSPTEYAQIRPSKPPRSTVPHTLAPDDKTEYASITKPKPNKRLDLQAV